MVALTRPVVTLYENHSWAFLSHSGHKEFKPSRQLLIWNQSLQGNSWKAVSSQICWRVQGRSTHQDCPGLCFIGQQSPGRMRARGTWPENKALRPWEVRFKWCWEEAGVQEVQAKNAGGAEGIAGTSSSCCQGGLALKEMFCTICT